MSDINEFDVSNNTYTLRAYTQLEIDAKNTFDAIPKTPEIIPAPLSTSESLVYATSQSGTAYTLSSDNLYKLTEFTSNSPITITIPNDVSDTIFPIGSTLEIRQMGSGRITFSYSSPVIVLSPENYLKTRTQYSSAMLEKRSSNSWILTGDIDS